MRKYNSIVYRLTGMSFILLISTIGILLFLVNLQMDQHFSEYLQYNGTTLTLPYSAHGTPEQHFMASVHHSLIWVGAAILTISLFISYLTARSITKPLCTLNEAAQTLKEGTYGKTVAITRQDEVGMLADTINAMSLQLHQNDQMRHHLFTNIAHELRTPLAIIQGNLEGMIDDVIPVNKTMLLSMEEEVLRVNRLVQDLRDLSLAEINELELHKEDTDINAMLSRAVNMLQPLIDEKNLSVQLDLLKNGCTAYIDKDRINQVLYNIISNAIRYIPEKSSICIVTDRVEKEKVPYISIRITDTGPGIAPEDIPYIFQYFYRGEKSRNRKSGGSGIGLALARQFVLSHGGTIAATSHPGKGTSFSILLPAGPA